MLSVAVSNEHEHLQFGSLVANETGVGGRVVPLCGLPARAQASLVRGCRRRVVPAETK